MNILLIEDNTTIIKGLKYSFEKNNYNLIYKTTINDAKTYLKDNSNIDLIILDITLPDGNGLQLFENIIKKLKIPTIFLTAKDDEETVVKGLKYSFEKNNYNLIYKTTINDAKIYLKDNSNIDLIILDITLPDGNGIELFESLIKKLNIPTIFLTAKDDEETVVKGLTIGAEDYITKPFSTKELLARINKILLRSKKQSIIAVKNIKFDMDKMIVYKDEEKINLTSLELKLLSLLFMNLNKVVSRNTIFDTIWEATGNDVDDHTITVYFKRIREKLGTDIITTVKGLGYRIDNEK